MIVVFYFGSSLAQGQGRAQQVGRLYILWVVFGVGILALILVGLCLRKAIREGLQKRRKKQEEESVRTLSQIAVVDEPSTSESSAEYIPAADFFAPAPVVVPEAPVPPSAPLLEYCNKCSSPIYNVSSNFCQNCGFTLYRTSKTEN